MKKKTKCSVCQVKLTKSNRQDKGAICRGCKSQTERQRNADLKAEVIIAYGGECVCCSCSIPEFLTIDHIDGKGAAHRRKLFGSARSSSDKLYRWLKKNEFPKKNFQLLCFNCNCAKHQRGVCPHQKEKT